MRAVSPSSLPPCSSCLREKFPVPELGLGKEGADIFSQQGTEITEKKWPEFWPQMTGAARALGADSQQAAGVNPVVEDGYVGFRVASVPEPSTYALLALATAGWGAHWWRRKVTF